MATDVILTMASLLLLALRTQQVAAPAPHAATATAEPWPSETASTVSEALGSTSLDTEGLTPELKVTAPTEFTETSLMTSQAPQSTLAVDSGAAASQNEALDTTTITSDVVNGKGRSAELSGACQAWSDADIDLMCSLPRAEVSVRGQAGSHVVISCLSGTELACEELPHMQLGLNRSIRLELHDCAPPPRLGCLAPRLSAALAQLYLFNPPGDVQVTADMLHGLDQLERFAVFGDGVDNYTMKFPRDALSWRPLLRSLTVNNIKLSLQPHDLDGVSGLEYLELSKVGLTSFPPAIFAKLNKLQKLNIWMNQIEDLHEDTFQGLTSLQQLDVSSNGLRSLHAVAAGLPTLVVLAVRANAIEALTSLARLQHLQKLELFGNKVPLSVRAGALASLPNLTHVNLQMNSLARLPEDLFHNSPALRTLKINNNDLTELPAGLFRDLKALEELDLSRNKLTELRPQGFEALSSLKKLDLSNNRITRLPPSVLFGACALTWLSVSHNAVRALAAGAMTCGGRNQLEDVDLSHNQLESLSPLAQTQYVNLASPFAALADSLRVLLLSHNALRTPPADVGSFVRLRRLDLSHNNLTELSYQDLSFLSAEAEVDYRHNRIATVRLPPAARPRPRPRAAPAPAPAHARPTVLLDDNPFDCDCKLYHFATRLHGYVPLDTTEARADVGAAACAAPAGLRARPLPAAPLGAFACTSAAVPALPCAPGCACAYRPHSAALHLTCPTVPPRPNTTDFPELHLELTLTEPQLAPFTFDVRVLNLSGLALARVPDALPRGLRLLDLSNNRLTEVPGDLLQSDIKLRLSGNSLQCDCGHKQGLRLLKEAWHNVEDGAGVACSGGAPFADVSVDALCSTRTAVLVGAPLALLGLLAAALALLLMRYSLEIRVWLHAKGLLAHWRAVDDAQRTYDAFVSFCHEDEPFVTQQLVPGLEAGADGRQPYRLCVHYRDWVPGEWIPAQIARSVADSRRTIIVVSKNFLDSLWGRAEFRTANMSAVKERQTRVIVVLLEDISSHKELDPELKAYLATNTYLKWGDPWFWEKLRYALPHRRQAPPGAGGKGSTGSAKGGAEGAEAPKGRQGLKGGTGLPEALSPAGLLVPAAVPPSFVNKCAQFDIEIGNLKGMDIADLKQIQSIT